MFPIGRVDISLMHQSIPAVPSSPSPPTPRATAGHFPALSAPDFVLPALVTGHMPTLGLFPNFSCVHGFLSEKKLRKGFYWKNKHIGSSVKDRKKLNRLVKACVRFYACISSLLILNQISVGITCISRTSFHIYSICHRGMKS